MDYKLTNKNILIISTEKWGTAFLSKHHYAIELAERGNNVYFLNPPDIKYKKFIKIINSDYNSNLKLIYYKPVFRGQRILPTKLFDLLKLLQVKLILAKIKTSLDIVWCFDPVRFTNLNWFNSKLKILHLMDFSGSNDDSKKIAESSDIIFYVSEYIIKPFYEINKPKYFINHGLSKVFLKFINELNNSPKRTKIKVGYIGNLLIKALDRKTFKEIIEQNKDIEFYFWGSSNFNESNLGGWLTPASLEFVEFLNNSTNVILKGNKPTEQFVNEIQEMDLFLLCYDIFEDINRGSNSHKLLEYLSTGKVVVSNIISTYKGLENLIQMCNKTDNSDLNEIFQKTIKNLDFYNSVSLMNQRRQFAFENTYEKQITSIENCLNKINVE